MHKLILPDVNSWLTIPLIDFFQLVKNEHNLTLWDAVYEYVESFSYECSYLKLNEVTDLLLYPRIKYDIKTRTAKLEKVYFVCKKIHHVLTWNYLQSLETLNLKKQPQNKKVSIPKAFENNFPGLNFTSQFNGTNYFETKELLLKHSYQREYIQKLIVVENQSQGYSDSSIDIAIITFDLNFLSECLFFNNARYKSFKSLLPPNLIIELPIKLNIEIKKIPEQLKEEQLIQLSKLKK